MTLVRMKRLKVLKHSCKPGKQQFHRSNKPDVKLATNFSVRTFCGQQKTNPNGKIQQLKVEEIVQFSFNSTKERFGRCSFTRFHTHG